MKKIIYILLGLLGIGGCVWYAVQPDVFMDCLNTITYYLNQPLPIVGVSVVTLMVFLWELYSHSAIGKKQLAEFKKENQEFKKEIEVKNKQLEEQKQYYEDKLGIVYSQFNFYETSVMAILEEIPNKKVQEKIIEFKNTYNEKKAEVADVMSDNYPAIEEKLKEMENQFKEFMAKYEKEINDETED